MTSRPAWLPMAQPVSSGAAPAQAQHRHVFLPEGAGTSFQQWGAKPSPYQQWQKPAHQTQPEAPPATEEPHDSHMPDGQSAACSSNAHWEGAGTAREHAWQPEAAPEAWHNPASAQVLSQPASTLHHNEVPAGTAAPPPGTPNGAASPTFGAAARLRSINEEISALKAKQAEVMAAIGGEAAAEAARLRAEQEASSGGDLSLGPPLPEDVTGLVQELCALSAAEKYAHSLQELVAVTKILEKVVRGCERAAAAQDLQALLRGVSDAVAAHSTAADQCEAVVQLPFAGIPSQLCDLAHASLARAASAQEALVVCLRGVLREQLARVGWPPPVAARPGSLGSSSSEQDLWRGLEGAHPQAVDELNKVLAAFIALQRSVQRSSFEAGVASGEGDAPALWAVEELAAPLAERLRAHFASGRPTDRPDRPEWLFGTALRLGRSLAPGLAPLQPAVAAHGLGGAYHVPLEFVRALRAAVQGILREHVLPRLARLGKPALWLHFVEQAVAFERELAPLRGLPPVPLDADAAGASEATQEPWVEGSCLELLPTHPARSLPPAWSSGWWSAEREEALRALHELMDAPGAWQPLPALWGAGSSGGGAAVDAVDGQTSVSEAWRSEFWAPAAAEGALGLVANLARKCAWLADAGARRQFAIAVPQEVLRKLRARLARLARTAEDFRDLAGPVWAPRIGAYMNAAHWLQHSLQEPSGPLLLLDLEDGRDGRGSVLSVEAEAFSAFKQKWTLKLARTLAGAFAEGSAAYRRPTNFEAFAAHGGEDREEGDVSPRLARALEGLAANLGRLAAALDGVVFRDCWRAVAVAATRAMFNDVATEARFSEQGARQFQADVAALIAVFQPYTPRPAAHLRELAEACTLLALVPEQAHAAAHRLPTLPHKEAVVELKALGVSRLLPEQALCVLQRRMY